MGCDGNNRDGAGHGGTCRLWRLLGRAGGGGGCWAVPSRWGGGRSPSTAWIRPGTPTPLRRLGRPIAHRPGETPAVPATCCRPLNLLPLNPARSRGFSQPRPSPSGAGRAGLCPGHPPVLREGTPDPPQPAFFSFVPPTPQSSQAPTARTWCDRIASLTRTSPSKVAKFGDPFHVPSVPGSQAAVPLTPQA